MKRTICLLTMLMALLLSGCNPWGIGDGYRLYYPMRDLGKSQGADAMQYVLYAPKALENELPLEEIARLLVEQEMSPVNAEKYLPLAQDTIVDSVRCQGNTVAVHLTGGYEKLQGLNRQIADYCLVLTLTQLEGIRFVALSLGEETVGTVLSAGDVLLSEGANVRRMTMQLYFGTDNGGLESEERMLELYQNESAAQAAIAELLRGPENPKLRRLLPESFALREIREEDGRCVLDLREETAQTLAERQEVYVSLELSLRSLGYDEVIFLCNGYAVDQGIFGGK